MNQNTSTLAMAFLGDALYELFVRERVVNSGLSHADKLHKKAVTYVCAASQAKALKALQEDLTEEEKDLVQRAKNHKIATKPKNADPMTYKWATAFEALLGWLWLKGDKERTNLLMEKASGIIEREVKQ